MLLLVFYYSSVLVVGCMAAWVLCRPLPSWWDSFRWILVPFPLILAVTFLLKPHGPSFWFRGLPETTHLSGGVLGAVLVIVSIRGACKIVDVAVNWARLRHETIPGDALVGAPWLGFEILCLRIGVPPPEIRYHRSLRSPVVVGWCDPVILFPGRLVPGACRSLDPFWEDLEEPDPDHALIQAMLIHELEHVRRWDPLRLALLVLNGIVLPWEWVAGRTGSGPVFRARPRFLPGLASLIGVLGSPYRWGMRAERRVQEDRADAAVRSRHPAGHSVLERARGPTSNPGFQGRAAPWRALTVSIAVCGILGIAPGRDTIRYAWGGRMTQLLDLPESWSLALEPGFGKASAGLLPAEGGEPGRILVHIEDLVPSHPPQLIGTGYFRLEDLPGAGWVEMTWDIHSESFHPEQEQMSMLIAAFRMVLDTRQEAVSFEAEVSSPLESLGDNTYRFHRRVELGHVMSGAYWLYLKYVFQKEGRWSFRPPVIEVVTHDGNRQPFPSACRPCMPEGLFLGQIKALKAATMKQ